MKAQKASAQPKPPAAVEEDRPSIDHLSANVSGVMHNLKSALMAVNGYIGILAGEREGKVVEEAKHASATAEAIIDKLVCAMRGYRNHEPATLSISRCVASVVELVRTNHTFRSKVRFDLEPAENDEVVAVPAELLWELERFLTHAATALLARGEYVLAVQVISGTDRVSVACGDATLTFAREVER